MILLTTPVNILLELLLYVIHGGLLMAADVQIKKHTIGKNREGQ
jgi:hypothetical protein